MIINTSKVCIKKFVKIHLMYGTMLYICFFQDSFNTFHPFLSKCILTSFTFIVLPFRISLHSNMFRFFFLYVSLQRSWDWQIRQNVKRSFFYNKVLFCICSFAGKLLFSLSYLLKMFIFVWFSFWNSINHNATTA